MKRFVVGSVSVLCFSCSILGVAWAEESDRNVARRHFERGVSLYEVGNYDRALEEFRTAYEAQPHPAVLINIANCYARTNRPVRAIQTFERYLREQGNRLGAEERAEIDSVLEEQRRNVGELSVRVEPAGAEVLIDGTPVGTSPIEHTETVRAGRHTVEVRVEGRPPLVRQGVIEGGQRATMTVSTLPGLAASPETPETPESPETPATPEAPGPVDPPAAPAGPQISMLRVEGTDGADVELDGDLVGEVPWEGEVEVGEHTLRLSGADLPTYENVLDFGPAERTEVSINLTRGSRPAWLPAVEWSLIGIGAGLIIPGIALVGTSYGRFLDSEAMFDEIERGNFSSRNELDVMWSRYNEMYNEYESNWATGWALFGVGLALAVAGAVILILDRASNVFAAEPEAEIDIFPIDESDVEDDFDESDVED